MKCASLPSSYRNWTFFTSVCTRGNFSPARKVSSITAPDSRFLSFVRTNAPPLPGFTCWKSMIRHTVPRCSMCIPFLNWFVLTISAMTAGGYLLLLPERRRARPLADREQVLRERGQDLAPLLGHDDQILDATPPHTGEVEPRLDGDHVSDGEHIGRFRPHRGCLVHLDPDPVAEAVTVCVAEAGRGDRHARCCIDIPSVGAGTYGVEPVALRLRHE